MTGQAAAQQFGNFTYVIDGAVVTITGYTGTGGAVTVPATINGLPVRSISGFNGKTAVTSVTIPDSVSFIGSYAFTGCTGLTSVTIPDSVTTIGGSAFSDCTGLTAMTIPDSVTTIGDYVFTGCTGLTSVVIPESATSIGASLLSHCTSLTSVTIPHGVTSIGDLAFDGCIRLTSATIPDGVTTIGTGAFNGCISLTGVTIPDSVTFIGSEAFRGCRSLTSVTLPSHLSSIQRKTFAGCTSLASIEIPAGVVAIESEAFHNCKGLASVTIHDGVTIIGPEAFSGCASLTSVAVPGAVIGIGATAFEDCPTLLEIVVAADNPAYVSVDGVLFNKNQTTFLQYPGGKPGGYVIPASVTSILGRAFRGCTGLTGVAIHGGVTTIGAQAFAKCPALLEIAVSPDNPNYLSEDGVLFDKNRSTLLQYPGSKPGAYDVPARVRGISVDAFRGCHALTRVTIPDSVAVAGGVFVNCTTLQEIIVSPANPTCLSVDGVLFDKEQTMLLQYPAGKAGGYVIPDGVGHIGIRAFSHCAHLTSVVIPDSVNGIWPEAFEDCTALTHVTIPAGVIWLDGDAFQSCSSLSSAVFMGNAPPVSYVDPPFDFTAPGFTIYYLNSRSGFASPVWQRYRTVALSPSDGAPEIVAVTATPGTFALVTVGGAGRTYRVERRPDLATGPWSTIATAGPLAEDQVLELTDPAAPTGQAFYRVVAVEP